MAATIAVLGTSVFNTTAGNKTITATPTNGDLIVIIAVATGVTTTITDNATGGTYTQVDSTRTGFSTTGNLQMFVRNNLVTGAASTVYTATQTSSTGGGMVILRVTGMTLTGASAVRSSGGQSTIAAGTPAPVLSLTPLSSNPIITAMANSTSTSTTNVVQRTGYTEDFDNGYNTPPTGLEVSHLASGETSATLTYGGATGSQFASIAIELQFNSAPTTALNTPADTATGQSTTPTLNFTGTDADADTLEYEVQVDTISPVDIVGTNLTNNGGTSATSFNTASISPGANNLILLTVVSGDIATPNVPTATGNSLTWVQVNTQGYGSGSGARVITVLRAMGASPTTGAITIDFAGQSQAECRWSVDQFTGIDTSGTNGSGAIVQSVLNSSAGASSLTVTLAALGNANNASFGAFGSDGENGSTKGTNYTLLATNGTSANLLNMLTEYRVAGDTTPNWSQGASAIMAGIGIEIKARVPVLDKFSASDAGFTAGHPFASGAAKDFTVQVGDALIANTIYYWRVRAIDPTGSDTYGAWATTRSFTTASAVAAIPNKIYSFMQAVNRSNTY